MRCNLSTLEPFYGDVRPASIKVNSPIITYYYHYFNLNVDWKQLMPSDIRKQRLQRPSCNQCDVLQKHTDLLANSCEGDDPLWGNKGRIHTDH